MYRKAPGTPNIAHIPAEPAEKATAPAVNNFTAANNAIPAAEFTAANSFGLRVRIYTEIISSAASTRKIIPNISSYLPLVRFLCSPQ